MPHPSWARIALGLSAPIASASAGTAVVSSLRGSNVTQSTSIVSGGLFALLGTIGVAGKLGFFGEIQSQPLSMWQLVSQPALWEAIGVAIGQGGAYLLFNTALSTEPVRDAALGYPITFGLMLCCKILLDYYDQNNQANAHLKPHAC